jgi:hypothetical protein
MRAHTTLAFLLTVVLGTGAALAQKEGVAAEPKMDAKKAAAMEKYNEAMQKAATPGPEHEKLKSITGSYDVATKFWMDPAGPPQEMAGKSEIKMMYGDRYQVQDFSGTMMGQPFSGHSMMGYDVARKKYFSTWIDSTSTGMSIGEGTADKSGNVITFTTSMTDPRTGKVVKGKDIITINPDGTFTMEGWYPPITGGKPFKMMEITYTKRQAAAAPATTK